MRATKADQIARERFEDVYCEDDIRLDHIPDAKECRELLRQFSAQGYWPNVFHVNDHGNVDLLRLTTRGARIIQSWV